MRNMRKRKMFLVLEVDAEELPAHLRGLLSRPAVEQLQTRDHWFETPEDKRAARRKARAQKQSEGA